MCIRLSVLEEISKEWLPTVRWLLKYHLAGLEVSCDVKRTASAVRAFAILRRI